MDNADSKFDLFDNVLELSDDKGEDHKQYQEGLRIQIDIEELTGKRNVLLREVSSAKQEVKEVREKYQAQLNKINRSKNIIQEAEESIVRIYENREALSDIENKIAFSESTLNNLENRIAKKLAEIEKLNAEESWRIKTAEDKEHEIQILDQQISLERKSYSDNQKKRNDLVTLIEEGNCELNQILQEISKYKMIRNRQITENDSILEIEKSLKSEIDSLKEKLKEKNTSLEAITKKTDLKSVEVEELEVEKVEVEATLCSLKDEYDKLLYASKSLTEENFTSNEILETLNEKKCRLIKEVDESNVLLEELQDTISKYERNIEQFNKHLNVINVDLVAGQKSLDNLLEKNSELNNENELLTRTEKELHINIEEKRNTIDRLDISIAKLQESEQGYFELVRKESVLKQHVSELNVKKDELDDSIKDMIKSKTELTNIVDSLTTRGDGLTNQIAKLEEMASSLKEEVEIIVCDRSSQVDHLDSEIESLEKKRDLLAKNIQDSGKLLSEQNYDLKELQNKLKNTVEEFECLTDKLSLKNKELEEKTLSMENVSQQYQETQIKLNSLNDHKVKLEGDIDIAKHNWEDWTNKKNELLNQISDAENRLKYLTEKNIDAENLKEKSLQEISLLKVTAQKELEEKKLLHDKNLSIERDEIIAEANRNLEDAKKRRGEVIDSAKQESQQLIFDAEREIALKIKRSEHMLTTRRLDEVKKLNLDRDSLEDKFKTKVQSSIDGLTSEIISKFNLSDDSDGVISELFDKHLNSGQKRDMELSTKKLLAALKANPKSMGSSLKFWKYFAAFSAASFALIVFVVIFPEIPKNIYHDLFKKSDDVYGEKYLADVKDQRKKSIFSPKKNYIYKSSYTDNILYTHDYLKIRFNSEFMNEFAIKLSYFVVGELQLQDDSVIEIISKESSLLRELVPMSESIPLKIKDQEVMKMRQVELEFRKELVKLLKGEVNYNRYQQFFREYYTKFREGQKSP